MWKQMERRWGWLQFVGYLFLPGTFKMKAALTNDEVISLGGAAYAVLSTED